MSRLLGRYTEFPKLLFRLSNGPTTRLRDLKDRPKGSAYDVATEDGNVEPIGVTCNEYLRPNGASMRGNTPMQQSIVQTFRGSSVRIFCVPAGTSVPDDLVLIHEHGEHYSLQPRVSMTLTELNEKITDFLSIKAHCLTKDEWQERFPESTE